MLNNNGRIKSDWETITNVFGYNPHKSVNTPRAPGEQLLTSSQRLVRDDPTVQSMTDWAATNHQISELSDLYQQQLVELNACHSLLTEDQERLAARLLPYVDADGRFINSPDEDTLIFKQGLDLRLLEFEEDCRRIQQTERRLQRKIDQCTLNYDVTLFETQGLAEEHLIMTIKDQQKLLSLQQRELDELRFQRDLYADETRRLRQICRYGEWVEDGIGRESSDEPSPPQTPRSLHQAYSGSQPPFEWMRNIRHSRPGTVGYKAEAVKEDVKSQKGRTVTTARPEATAPKFKQRSSVVPSVDHHKEPGPQAEEPAPTAKLLSSFFGVGQAAEEAAGDDAQSDRSAFIGSQTSFRRRVSRYKDDPIANTAKMDGQPDTAGSHKSKPIAAVPSKRLVPEDSERRPITIKVSSPPASSTETPTTNTELKAKGSYIEEMLNKVKAASEAQSQTALEADRASDIAPMSQPSMPQPSVESPRETENFEGLSLRRRTSTASFSLSSTPRSVRRSTSRRMKSPADQMRTIPESGKDDDPIVSHLRRRASEAFLGQL